MTSLLFGPPGIPRSVSKRVSDGLKSLDNSVFGSGDGYLSVGVSEFNCVRDNLALGVHLDKLEATVRVERGPDIKSFFCTKVPGSPRGRLGVDEDATTHWTEWRFVEIEWSIEVFPS